MCQCAWRVLPFMLSKGEGERRPEKIQKPPVPVSFPISIWKLAKKGCSRVQGSAETLKYLETVRDSVSISNVAAGRYYKAMRRFILQILQAVSKKTKGILCVLREVMLQACCCGSAHLFRWDKGKGIDTLTLKKKINLLSNELQSMCCSPRDEQLKGKSQHQEIL